MPIHAFEGAAGVSLRAFVLHVLQMRGNTKVATSVIERVAGIFMIDEKIGGLSHEKPMKIHRRPSAIGLAHAS